MFLSYIQGTGYMTTCYLEISHTVHFSNYKKKSLLKKLNGSYLLQSTPLNFWNEKYYPQSEILTF